MKTIKKTVKKPTKKIINKTEKVVQTRLNKYIAESGLTSRRKADEMISEGLVKVNGETITELGYKINVGDNVSVSGDPLNTYRYMAYILLNKPKDYITTTSDEKHRKTVMDLIKTSVRLFPVGRLDRNSTGVLLLTNDGELTNRLTHPKYKIERTYNVTLDKKLTPEDAKTISNGVKLEEYETSPCDLFIYPDDRSKVTIILHEGKNREIRRIFESLGYEVKSLDRKAYGTLTTRGLGRGEYRKLNKSEISELKKLVGLS